MPNSGSAWPGSLDGQCVYRTPVDLNETQVRLSPYAEACSELLIGLTCWSGYYNAYRPHSGLAGQTPDEAYGAIEYN